MVDLKEFFEGNSTSLEVMEVYENFCLEKNKKVALNSVWRELKDEYCSERELYIVFLMTLYYCALEKNFTDEKSKCKLELLKEEEIYCVFGESNGKTVLEALKQLLGAEPRKPERSRIDLCNPGSKEWKRGDVFAYPLLDLGERQKDFVDKYAIIQCIDKEEITKRQSNVMVYISICDASDVKMPLEYLLKSPIFIPSFALHGVYRYKLISKHHEYPTSKLLYLGNTNEIKAPENEMIPKDEYFIPLLSWKRFEDNMLENWLFKAKYNK